MLFNYHVIDPKYTRIRYFSDNSIICDFDNDDHDVVNHQESTVILLTPYINNLFAKTIDTLTKDNDNNSLTNRCFNKTEFHGFPWNSMEFYGFPRNSMEIHRYQNMYIRTILFSILS